MNPHTIQIPSWQMTGIVAETRPLKTKDDEIWAYSIKVMATGGTYDLFTKDGDMFKKCGEGEQIVARGRLEPYGNSLKLLVNYIGTEGEEVKDTSNQRAKAS